MIQPVQSHTTLLQDIQTTELRPYELAVWWLGQSGYAFKSHSKTFYIDLYLSDHLTKKYADTAKPHIRMTESPLHPNEITDAKLIFSSHKHSDHLDPGTMPQLFQASQNADLVLPAALLDYAVELGLERERLVSARGDDYLEFGDMKVHVLPSAHPDLDYTEEFGYPYLGYVFQLDGLTFYHSGDTVIYDGLAQRLHRFDLDLVFLPINGTDEHRTELKVPPNMDIQDALNLAEEVGASLLIPHHYDMFTFNTVDIDKFIKAAQQTTQNYEILNCGEKFVYRKRERS